MFLYQRAWTDILSEENFELQITQRKNIVLQCHVMAHSECLWLENSIVEHGCLLPVRGVASGLLLKKNEKIVWRQRMEEMGWGVCKREPWKLILWANWHYQLTGTQNWTAISDTMFVNWFVTAGICILMNLWHRAMNFWKLFVTRWRVHNVKRISRCMSLVWLRILHFETYTVTIVVSS